MKTVRASHPPAAARFRRHVVLAIMAVVAACTGAALYLARTRIAAEAERGFEQEFQGLLATLDHVRQLRHSALLERGRALARKARIIAALEDGALDLLYLSARDELRDAVARPAGPEPGGGTATSSLGAQFYRFLDHAGRVLTPPSDDEVSGRLSRREESGLFLPRLTARPQSGYLARDAGAGGIDEIIATSIFSSETGDPIAALVLGFEPVRLPADRLALAGFTSGVWSGAHLSVPGLASGSQPLLLGALQRQALTGEDRGEGGRFLCSLEGGPHLVFYKNLNPDSLFPAAYEVCLFPLAAMEGRQRRVAWQIMGAGAVLLLGGFIASHRLAGRLAEPVAVLAQDSEEQRVHRRRAEAALEATSAELERAARFSADASHQLKTPVTVLRAGLEELIARGAVPAEEIEEVSSLIHQTYRLSTLIEDLLLLSRMDAGQLQIIAGTVDLSGLIDASLDDLSAAPDELALAIESDHPPTLPVAGERRYVALILQNLLENARKYNRPGGRIRIEARTTSDVAFVTVGNTTRRPIPSEAQTHIFERFHRGTMGENIPGYGIGLNLARELARLHQGELRLVRSDEAWTEFEVRFRSVPSSAPLSA